MTSPSQTYDANGNQGASFYGMDYDAENRLFRTGTGTWYAYDGQNKRVWQWGGTVDGLGNATGYLVNFYGVDGKRLAQYQFTANWNGSASALMTTTAGSDMYFRARRLAPMDRLGSAGKYYPYGEDKGTGNPANDNWKFGTYWRDGATGLDYADQRYYSSTLGRFMTADPSGRSRRPSSPLSWNRYTYVLADPANHTDRHGLNEDASNCCEEGDNWAVL
jgi:RHS repeat-associated protein